MQEKNRLGKIEFIFEQIFWAFISMLWYKNVIFRCLEGLTFHESKIVLWFLIIVFGIGGMICQFQNRRNFVSVTKNLLIPYGIYTVLTYLTIREVMIKVVLAITLCLFGIYALLVMLRKIQNKKRFIKILVRRVKRVLAAGYTMMATGFAVILILIGYNVFFGSSIVQASAAETNPNEPEEYTIAGKSDELNQLKAENWKELTVQEKIDVLQIVANIERNYLGLSNELTVGAANLTENLNAYYNENTHEIVINMDYVIEASSWDLVQTVCHESYHSFQYCLIEAYEEADEDSKGLRIFKNAESYRQEFENYINGYEDVYAYANQKCESDAREYAEEGMYEYYTRIEGIPGE